MASKDKGHGRNGSKSKEVCPGALPSKPSSFTQNLPSTMKYLFKTSAKRRIIQHVVPSEAIFPIFSRRTRWSGDHWERYDYGWSLLGFVELAETRWSFSCSLTVFVGIVLFLCYYGIHPCFQAAVYHTHEEGELKMEQSVKRLISSSPAHRKLVNVY